MSGSDLLEDVIVSSSH